MMTTYINDCIPNCRKNGIVNCWLLLLSLLHAKSTVFSESRTPLSRFNHLHDISLISRITFVIHHLSSFTYHFYHEPLSVSVSVTLCRLCPFEYALCQATLILDSSMHWAAMTQKRTEHNAPLLMSEHNTSSLMSENIATYRYVYRSRWKDAWERMEWNCRYFSGRSLRPRIGFLINQVLKWKSSDFILSGGCWRK